MSTVHLCINNQQWAYERFTAPWVGLTQPPGNSSELHPAKLQPPPANVGHVVHQHPGNLGHAVHVDLNGDEEPQIPDLLIVRTEQVLSPKPDICVGCHQELPACYPKLCHCAGLVCFDCAGCWVAARVAEGEDPSCPCCRDPLPETGLAVMSEVLSDRTVAKLVKEEEE